MSDLDKLNFAQKNCLKTVGLAMHKTAMIGPGSRVGLAVSGGVDSFTMLQVLLLRKRIVPFSFELMVLHVNAGFDAANHAPLMDWCADHGVAAHFEVTTHGPDAHSEVNRKRSACFYCAMQRRKRLFTLCRQYGLTHLAFGHTAEDLVDTFFMNIFQNGRVDGLRSRDDFFHGDLTVIRPMFLCDKPLVRRAAAAWELPVFGNPCPSAGATKRSEMHDWLAERWKNDRRIRKNVYNALCRWQLDADSHIP